MTAPISSTVVSRFTFTDTPEAWTPFAMKTIVNVFATVQKKKVSSHQA